MKLDRNIKITKFLDEEAQSLIQKKYKDVIFYPDFCERKRAITFNDVLLFDQEINENTFQIGIVKISYNKKFSSIKHKDVLGAVLALGIKRDCVGDIIIDDDIYVFTTKEMCKYIITSLVSVGSTFVNVSQSSVMEARKYIKDTYFDDTIIISSYRLDVIIKDICAMSREKAKQYIVNKNVKINGVINTTPDYNVKINELISIHRFGRVQLVEELKSTKKDKHVIRVMRTR